MVLYVIINSVWIDKSIKWEKKVKNKLKFQMILVNSRRDKGQMGQWNHSDTLKDRRGRYTQNPKILSFFIEKIKIFRH